MLFHLGLIATAINRSWSLKIISVFFFFMLLVSLLLLSFFLHFLTLSFFCLCIHLSRFDNISSCFYCSHKMTTFSSKPRKHIFKSDIYVSSSFEDIFLITFKLIFNALRGHFKGGHLCSTMCEHSLILRHV